MTFEITKNITLDGEFQVGAHADVTYRVESGKPGALNIRVSS